MAEEPRIAELIFKRLQHRLSSEETDELEAWMNESAANRAFVETQMSNEYIFLRLQGLLEMDDEAIQRKIEARPLVPMPTTITIKPFLPNTARIGWRRGVSVAAAVIVAVLSVVFFSGKDGPHERMLSQAEKIEARLRLIAGVSERPALQVKEGDTIFLDRVAEGIVWEKDGWRLLKTGSQQITYLPGQGTPATMRDHVPAYHTMAVPFGQSWIVSLPDHSKVQLNAGSSLSYPLAGGPDVPNERNLVLRGEAHVEVADIGQSPFIITTRQASLKALGTVFDVKDYDKIKGYRAAVIRGAINVDDGKSIKNVGPGEAAVILPSTRKMVVVPFDTTRSVDWRSPYFDFTQLDVRASLNELGQWYGMDEILIYPGVDTIGKGLLKEGKIIKPPDLNKEFLDMLGGKHLYLWKEGKKLIASATPKPIQ